MNRLVDERVLVPIREDRPSGEDLRPLREWVLLRGARPRPEVDLKEWTPANISSTDWATYRDMVESALRDRSKDLELGVFLTEASAHVYGFRGARDGLWTIRGLVETFRERGLLPEPDEGDLEAQYGKLDWLNEKLGELVRDIPITRRPEPGVNYSLNFRSESLRPNGMITQAEFEAAVAASSDADYESMVSEIEEAIAELQLLEATLVQAYGETTLSFTDSRQAFEDCRAAVAGVVRRRKSGGAKPEPAGPAVVAAPPLPAVAALKLQDGNGAGTGNGTHNPWQDAEQLAKAGEIDRALGAMAGLAASEANGRVRFQRKLLLADLCLQTGRKRLAVSILEELHQLVEAHRLDTWETTEIIGAVWSRLVHCYRDQDAGTADQGKEAELFLKLSRLDPWQALTCGEPQERR